MLRIRRKVEASGTSLDQERAVGVLGTPSSLLAAADDDHLTMGDRSRMARRPRKPPASQQPAPAEAELPELPELPEAIQTETSRNQSAEATEGQPAEESSQNLFGWSLGQLPLAEAEAISEDVGHSSASESESDELHGSEGESDIESEWHSVGNPAQSAHNATRPKSRAHTSIRSKDPTQAQRYELCRDAMGCESGCGWAVRFCVASAYLDTSEAPTDKMRMRGSVAEAEE